MNTSLRQQIAERKKSDDEQCLDQTNAGQAVLIEFQLSAYQRVGYAAGHLLHYELSTQRSLAGDATTGQTLTLGFSTADVVISGLRLESVCDCLAEGRLAALRILPARYAELQPLRPFIAKIEVKPIGK